MNVPTTATSHSKGFTIIEVVLVLAIAGLIFLMVFIALPALQRNQRDQAKRTEVGTVASAVTSYQSNSRNASPFSDTNFAGYIDGTGGGAVGADGNITLSSGTVVRGSNAGTTSATVPAVAQIVFFRASKCTDAGNGVVAGTSRQVAVTTRLENGNAIYCQSV